MIRKESHILKILTLIFKIWTKYPTLRLMQLLSCFETTNDMFYVSDEKLVRQLKKNYGLALTAKDLENGKI